MRDYAFWSCNAMLSIDHTVFGLSVRPELPTGLLVGRVCVGVHPLTGRINNFGSHAHRVFPIETITIPDRFIQLGILLRFIRSKNVARIRSTI